MFHSLPPVCRGLILAIVASAMLSIISPALVLQTLPLSVTDVTHNFQIWRLITYPFVFLASGSAILRSILNLVWVSMIIAMFGGELETIIHEKKFAIGLGATILAGGLLFLLVGSQGGALMGQSVITIYCLTGFSYLWPKREISIFGLFWVKAWIIALALFVIEIIPMTSLSMDFSAANLLGPFMGAIGALVYFHITYRQYNFGRALIDRAETIRPGGGPAKPKLDASDPRAIELQIDALLDKISANGMDSLSKDEKAFLLKHST